MAKRGPSENYVLTEAEREALLRTCKDIQERVIILLPLYLGVRVSEAIHMDSRWIGDTGNLRVPSQMVCGCSGCAERENNRGHWVPKTKAGAREIGIPGIVSDDLSPFLAQYPRGLRMSRYAFYRHAKRLMKAAGIVIPGLGGDTAYPHVLRATCATMLAAGGMNAPQLCFHMGWGDLKVAQKYINKAAMQATAPAAAVKIFGG